MSESLFEKKPRWQDAPPICIYENLFAFKDEKEIGKFKDQNCPSAPIIEKWKCKMCDHYHFIPSAPAPAGNSSGTQRAFTPSDPQFRKDCPHKKYTETRNDEKKLTERKCDACGKSKTIYDTIKPKEKPPKNTSK